ncbi:uncharacterized protein LOC107813866 [Nicotiana tabacum]|uniref:Uncharacterized protein LOC107813866 n=2 Tax=Nicotiana TaxID=4085 RepID=A0A1S4C0I6_TOBAC|nr:PREDICTED: uncharacterized protein LOC104225962 [Nicotiana sylvestris]XP_016494666.1 PREDICTED: uncharacterized protein LOC107813866 [Nicotiana tabacum]
MATSSKSNHIRSISLPARSHPTTKRVEDAVNNLKTLKISTASTAETMHVGLLGLEELYKCMNDLLNLPQTLQALSQYQQGKLVEDLLDKSVRLLDLCGTIMELVLQYKENVRNLQSSLRRRKTDSITETSMAKFTTFNKKIKKEAKRLVLVLKQMDQEAEGGFVPKDADQDTVDMIKTLKEANEMRISIFQMFLSFLSVPLLKPKTSKWSLVSSFVNKGRIACVGQEEKMNLENRLESFEAHLDNFENGLEGLFRRMNRSRSSLLNMKSC